MEVSQQTLGKCIIVMIVFKIQISVPTLKTKHLTQPIFACMVNFCTACMCTRTHKL